MVSALTGIFPTADGWLAIAGVPGTRRGAFFAAIGAAELADDARFGVVHLTRDDKAELFDRISAALAVRPTAAWCAVFREPGVRFAPVRDYAEIAKDPQVWANGYLARLPGPAGHQVIVGTPIRFHGTPAASAARPPNWENIPKRFSSSWDTTGARLRISATREPSDAASRQVSRAR
jgi:formyl-CoA transferase